VRLQEKKIILVV